MTYSNNPLISITTFRHAELPKMPRSGTHGFSERERALVHEPLKLTPAQSQRLIRAAIRVDASIWRQEMEKLEEQGITVRNPNWMQVSMKKLTPWFEFKAQLVLTTGLPFREVLELTVGDLRFSECENRFEVIDDHKLTDECSALLEAFMPFDHPALFPWTDRAHATSLWLRVCRNGGLLRGHSAKMAGRS